MILVVDASVVVKLFVQEPGSEQAEKLFASSAVLLAPRLVLIETASTLTKKVRRAEIDMPTANEAIQALSDAALTGILDLREDQPLIGSAADLSLSLGHALYDCLYLALAIREEGRLITADQRFEHKLLQAGFSEYVQPF